MKRPVAHVIDQDAQNILLSAIPSAWIPKEIKPDYGVDYLVEIVEGGDLTGSEFGVQLKGHDKLKPLKSAPKFVSESVPCENLIDFLDCRRYPVFIVAVDKSTKTGYWLFSQKYLLENVKKKGWRKQKELRLRIPIENVLTNTDALRNAVREAEEFMTNLRPASIPTAIATEQKRVETLDPRLAVRIDAKEDRTWYNVSAKEPVSLTLTLVQQDGDLAEKLKHLFDRGLPTKFAKGEVAIQGSPLFEKFNDGEPTIQIQRTADASVNLLAKDDMGNIVGECSGIPGKVEAGRKEMRFKPVGSVGPLSFTLTFGEPNGETQSQLNFSYRLNWDMWVGRPLLDLSGFEALDSLYTALDSGAGFHIETILNGNRHSGHVDWPTPDEFLEPMNLLELLGFARSVAKACNVNPNFTWPITKDDVKSILELHWYCCQRDARPAKGEVVTTPVRKSGVPAILKKPETDLRLVKQNVSQKLLDAEVVLPTLGYEVMHVRLANADQEIRDALKDESVDHVNLKWVGKDNATMRPFVEF